jgi:hypothetical protein
MSVIDDFVCNTRCSVGTQKSGGNRRILRRLETCISLVRICGVPKGCERRECSVWVSLLVGVVSDMRGSNSETFYASVWTEIVIKSARPKEARRIPFWEELVRTGRIMDDEAEREWVDDAERRLRQVLSGVQPQPTLAGYVAERLADGLELYTITPIKIDKTIVALLCAGQWPHWDDIVAAVPEFSDTHVTFDGLSRFEWCRRWDLEIQRHRIQAEYGVFG